MENKPDPRIAELESKNLDLQKELDAQKSLAALHEAEIAEQKAQLAALAEAFAESQNEKSAISKPAAAPKTVSGKTFKVGSKTYRAVYPSFVMDGKTVTEADLLEDKKLQKELVDSDSRVIEEAD